MVFGEIPGLLCIFSGALLEAAQQSQEPEDLSWSSFSPWAWIANRLPRAPYQKIKARWHPDKAWDWQIRGYLQHCWMRGRRCCFNIRDSCNLIFPFLVQDYEQAHQRWHGDRSLLSLLQNQEGRENINGIGCVPGVLDHCAPARNLGIWQKYKCSWPRSRWTLKSVGFHHWTDLPWLGLVVSASVSHTLTWNMNFAFIWSS